MTDPDLPLAGVRVVTMAEQYPGPYATLILADLGADVIMIERPEGGDPARKFPGFFDALNRNKRSVVVDLKTDRGREQLRSLLRTADVFLEGFRPGVIDRLGFDRATVHDLNADVVYVSISGYGQTGPYARRPAHDLTYQAVAGVLHEHVAEDTPGLPGPLPVADLTAGTFAAIACLAGLVSRRHGRGAPHVDLSMVDALVSWMTTQAVPVLNGTGGPGIPREPAYGMFRTSDGQFITLSIAHEDVFWVALTEALDLGRYAGFNGPERIRHFEEIHEALRLAVASRTAGECDDLFDAHGIPFGPANGLTDLPEDPQLRSRDLFIRVPADETHAERVHIRQPLVIVGQKPRPMRHSPQLGEHTAELLAELAWRD